ncbi:glutathione S-transferase family protein [Sulfitobacter pacificus]|uniref:glutathione S-transferase family protein n=1 Tax=Sulfitobacter pacificus TaxID=1499314 RepID=UPI00360C9534
MTNLDLHLYHSPYSTCSQKVRLCLWEKNLPFEVTEIHFWKNEHLTPEYLALNPNGVVPTLLHKGSRSSTVRSSLNIWTRFFPRHRCRHPMPWDVRGCGPGCAISKRCRQPRSACLLSTRSLCSFGRINPTPKSPHRLMPVHCARACIRKWGDRGLVRINMMTRLNVCR